jgi:hypothetical protein
MAGIVLNIKVFSMLKLRSDLTGKYHATCHYSYNLPLNETASGSNPAARFFVFLDTLKI